MATAVPEVAQKKDIQIGWVVAAVCVIGTIAYLIIATYQMADPPPREYIVAAETVIPDELEFKDLKVEMGNAGSGSPTNDPIAEPKPQQTEVLSSTKTNNTKVKNGKSDKTNSQTNSNNGPTTTHQSNNPFGSGGNNGKNGSGTSPFGDDVGNGGDGPAGPGSGEGGRSRLNDPDTKDIVPDRNAKVYLKVTINANGDVLTVVNIPAKTTTTDGRIINQVIAAVKRDVRYSKAPGTANAVQFITVNLYAK